MSLHQPTSCIPQTTVFRPIGFDAFESPALQAGYQYWLSRCGGRRFPARADIRPRDIAGMLRHVALVKVDGDDFVYRIVGDVIVMSFDMPMQNRRLSDLVYDEPGFGIFVIPLMRKIVETGEPIALRGRIGRDVARVNFTECENLLMPLGPGDDTVDHILTVSSYISHPFAPS